MRPEEVTALGELAGDASAGLAAQIRKLHHGIAERAFAGVGAAAAPARLLHDQISHYAYELLRFPVEHYHHLGGANHFDLLNHPAIYSQLSAWLAGRPALAVGAAAE